MVQGPAIAIHLQDGPGRGRTHPVGVGWPPEFDAGIAAAQCLGDLRGDRFAKHEEHRCVDPGLPQVGQQPFGTSGPVDDHHPSDAVEELSLIHI